MNPEPPFSLDFDWDPRKAAANHAKHGVTFTEAASVFSDPLALTVFDIVHRDIEERWFTLGQSKDARLLAVAHTYSDIDDRTARIRVISARPATRNEHRQYASLS